MTKLLAQRKVVCNLCPDRCYLQEGHIGKCLSRMVMSGQFVPILYSVCSCVSVDPIEKKPFLHFLPGTKSLTIGGFGCNLHCKFCENYKITQVDEWEEQHTYHPYHVVSLALRNECQSVCMSYNEPTINYEYLISLAKATQPSGLKFIIKTNAYINKEPWKHICNVTDAMNIDWKGSKQIFKEITFARKYVYEDRIKEAYDKNIHIEISIPLYYNTQEDLVREMGYFGRFLSSIDKNIPCHLLKISPSYQYEDFVFNNDNIRIAHSILSSYLNIIHI